MSASAKPRLRRGSEDLARAHDQNSRILAKLREAGSRGVTNSELWALGAHAAHSRISDLRKRGHKITCEREGQGVWRYRLVSEEGPGDCVTGLALFDLGVRQ